MYNNSSEIEFIDFLNRFEKMIKSEALKSEADIKTKKSSELKVTSLKEIRSIIKQMINVIHRIEAKSSSKIKIESELVQKIPIFLATVLNSPQKDILNLQQARFINKAIEKAEVLKKATSEFYSLKFETSIPKELHIDFSNLNSTKNDVGHYLKKLKVMKLVHERAGNAREEKEKIDVMCAVGYCDSLLKVFNKIKGKSSALAHEIRLIDENELPKKVSSNSLAYLFFLAAGRRYSVNIISDIINEIKKSSIERKK